MSELSFLRPALARVAGSGRSCRQDVAELVRRLRRPRIAHQVLLMQFGVVALLVGIGYGSVTWMLSSELTTQFEQRALALARTVASDPLIVDAAARNDPQHVVQSRAEAIRVRTGALFVVVTNVSGVRLSHPDPARVGGVVSTDASQVLLGKEVTNVDRGTLGTSARAKVPLRDASGRVVGEVSVGFALAAVQRRIQGRAGLAAAMTIGSLLVGVVASILLSRRLRRLTLGIEPHELAALVQEREAVLRGIGDGVLAFDARGRVSVCNEEAARLLGGRAQPGTPLSQLNLPARLLALTSSDNVTNRIVTIAQDRVLMVNYRRVRHHHEDLGGVLTLRDHTDLDMLTRKLDAVQAVTDALRAQRHEFHNRLHTIAGLLYTQHQQEAMDYVQALAGAQVPAVDQVQEGIRDPYLQALLSVKCAQASEQGVEVRIDLESAVAGVVIAAAEVTTVVGNLIDNAIEAARAGRRRPPWVMVSMMTDAQALVVEVCDSGDGISDDLGQQVFVEGVSTRGDGRGLGLALARHVAHGRGGRIRLVSLSGPTHGAIFVARIPKSVQPAQDAANV